MCNSKDDYSKEIESLGFIGLTKVEIQEFEEQIAMDEDFRRFIQADRSKKNSLRRCKDERFITSEIDTEDSHRIRLEELSYAEY